MILRWPRASSVTKRAAKPSRLASGSPSATPSTLSAVAQLSAVRLSAASTLTVTVRCATG